MTAAWMAHVRAQLQQIEAPPGISVSARAFLEQCYRANRPDVARFVWPALDWTIETLRWRIGGALVQVQHERRRDPDYEINAPAHRAVMPFGQFLDRMLQPGAENDLYMTAQNAGENVTALRPLWVDVGPFPGFLRPAPATGFVWFGRGTVTPLHHDETNNYLFQVIGEKHVRMFPPGERERLSPTVGVHSSAGWVSDESIEQRGIRRYHDVMLSPGQALFIPIGWWHCVRAPAVSLSVVYTNFIFPNFFGRVDGIPEVA